MSECWTLHLGCAGILRLPFWTANDMVTLPYIYSATSVDVEESLYRKAQALGISVVTISQVQRTNNINISCILV